MEGGSQVDIGSTQKQEIQIPSEVAFALLQERLSRVFVSPVLDFIQL